MSPSHLVPPSLLPREGNHSLGQRMLGFKSAETWLQKKLPRAERHYKRTHEVSWRAVSLDVTSVSKTYLLLFSFITLKTMEESIKDPGAKLSIAPNAQHTYTSCTSMHSKHAHTHPYSHSKHVPYAHHINMYTAYTPYTHHIHAYISYTEHTLYTCYTHFSIIYMHIQRTLCIHTILIHCNPYMRHIFKYHTTHIYIYHTLPTYITYI